MQKNRLYNFLCTPKGILMLFGVTYFVVVLMAVGIATQRTFFESYIVEKYKEPTAKVIEILKESDPEHGIKLIGNLSSADQEAVYEAWMQSQDSFLSAPYIMMKANPTLFLERAKRTFFVGSMAQKEKALRFLSESRHESATELFSVLRNYARERNDVIFEQKIMEAMQEVSTVDK